MKALLQQCIVEWAGYLNGDLPMQAQLPKCTLRQLLSAALTVQMAASHIPWLVFGYPETRTWRPRTQRMCIIARLCTPQGTHGKDRWCLLCFSSRYVKQQLVVVRVAPQGLVDLFGSLLPGAKHIATGPVHILVQAAHLHVDVG